MDAIKSLIPEVKESYFKLNAKNHKDIVEEINSTLKLF